MLEGKKFKKFTSHDSLIDYIEERHTELEHDDFMRCGLGLVPALPFSQQPCLEMFSYLKLKYRKTIRHINHYTLRRCCKDEICYCARQWTDTLYILTTHQVGECPLCYYKEEKPYKEGEHEDY